ncbi:MAG: hypothetical protein CMF50_03220 [Legionellales bacterium]|nr:hypothetical protein [Legionellales bacterium]|tara:strand:+ start:16229 stop:16480 length:252 start_codon:yes stop_codon:yes gene_type:complete
MFMYGASHGKDRQVSCATGEEYPQRLVQNLNNALRNASVNLSSAAVSEATGSFKQRDAEACGQALRHSVENGPAQQASHGLKA